MKNRGAVRAWFDRFALSTGFYGRDPRWRRRPGHAWLLASLRGLWHVDDVRRARPPRQKLRVIVGGRR